MTEFSPDPDNSDSHDGSMPSYHMSPEEFRRHGHALIDWLAHYIETVGERQVMPDVEPGDIAARIPATAPEKPGTVTQHGIVGEGHQAASTRVRKKARPQSLPSNGSKARSGCGIIIVERPSVEVTAVMPAGEPFGLKG